MIEYLVLSVLGFAIGWKASQIFHVLSFKQILEDLNISNEDLRKLASRHGMELAESPTENSAAKSETVLEVKLEQHGTEIYAFRKDNDQFLGQGKDADTLIKRLTENLTPCRVIVAKEDGAELLQNAGQSK